MFSFMERSLRSSNDFLWAKHHAVSPKVKEAHHPSFLTVILDPASPPSTDRMKFNFWWWSEKEGHSSSPACSSWEIHRVVWEGLEVACIPGPASSEEIFQISSLGWQRPSPVGRLAATYPLDWEWRINSHLAVQSPWKTKCFMLQRRANNSYQTLKLRSELEWKRVIIISLWECL